MYTAVGKVDDKEAIYKSYLMMVRKIAFQFIARTPKSVEVEDLIQAGMIGLMDAVSRYEEMDNGSFTTYAHQRIRGAIIDELRGMDELSRHMRGKIKVIEEAIQNLHHTLGRQPLEQEIADQAGISLGEYQKTIADANSLRVVMMGDLIDEESGEPWADGRFESQESNPLDTLLEEGFKTSLGDAIGELPEREKLALSLYYDEEMNLREIGTIMNITESRVCQLLNQATTRLRAKLRKEKWI